jgi:hypothetical protein
LRSRLRALKHERSNTTYLGALGFTPREAGQSEQVAKQVASAKNRPRASSELMRAVEEGDRVEGDRKKLKMRSMERGDRQFKSRTRALEPPSRAFAISRVAVS